MSAIPQGYGQSVIHLSPSSSIGPGSDTSLVIGWQPLAVGAVWPDYHTRIHAAFKIFLGAALCGPWQHLGTSSIYQSGVIPTPALIADTAEVTPGVVALNPTPPNVACLVRKFTGVAGRGNRGRMFLPGVTPTGDVTSLGTISTSRTGVLNAFLVGLKSNLESTLATPAGAPVRMVVLHSLPGLTPAVVSQLQVQPTIATQRRRLR